MKWFFFFAFFSWIAFSGCAQSDTISDKGRIGTFHINIEPVPCDPNKHDSLSLSRNLCFDTTRVVIWQKCILDIADSIALAHGVPPNLVYEIGMNESRWPEIYDFDYLIRQGDLQVIDRSFDHLYKKLELTGGKTRYNYLVVAIHYLKMNYNRYQSWEKARYAYGRGHWKPRSQWTAMERHFMDKIDWSQYDGE
jgi:hypothetical protein